MVRILDTVALTRDIAHAGLRRGDLGAVVAMHSPDAVEVEFVAATGRTQALLTLTTSDLRSLDDDDLIAVRSLADIG